MYTGAEAGTPTGIISTTLVGQQPTPNVITLTSPLGGDTQTFAVSTYTTMATIQAAIVATGKWQALIDPSLDSSTPTAKLIGHVSAINLTRSKTDAVGFACGGGALTVAYTGQQYKRIHIYRNVGSSNIVILGDGVQLGAWTVTTITLAALMSNINSLGVTGLTAALCNNSGVSNNSCHSYNSLQGYENAGCIAFGEFIEVGKNPIVLNHYTMGRTKVISNQFKVSQSVAAANGVTLNNFSQSGGYFYPSTCPGVTPYQIHRGNTQIATQFPGGYVINTAAQQNFSYHQQAILVGVKVYCSSAATLQLTSAGLLIGTATNSFSLDLTSGSYATIKQVVDAINGTSGWSATAPGLSVAVSPNHDASSVLEFGQGPFAVPAGLSNGQGVFITASNLSKQREIAALYALADSQGFYTQKLVHKLISDGSSAFTGMAAVDQIKTTGDLTESAFAGMLATAQSLAAAGKIQIMTPNQFVNMRAMLNKPANLVFNPKFKNSISSGAGDRLLAFEGSPNILSFGDRVPGWGLWSTNTGNVTAASISPDGVFSITTNSTSTVNPFYQYVQLEPGFEYEFGADVEFVNCAASPTVRFSLFSVNKAAINSSPSETASQGYRFRTIGDNNSISQTFFVDKTPNREFAQLISKNAEPYNLSTNNQIGLNIDNRGVIANINCSTGAVSAAAVTAFECVAAINAGIKASGTYPAEFWNCASAIGGKVVITSPYLRSVEAFPAVVTSAGPADAQTTIFGSTNNKIYSGLNTVNRASDYVYQLALGINASGTINISNIYIRQIGAVA